MASVSTNRHPIAMPVTSYAAAAKGQKVAQPAPQPVSSPAPPSTRSLGKDDDAAVSSSTSVTSPSPHFNGSVPNGPPKITQLDSDLLVHKPDSELASVGESATSAGPTDFSSTVSLDDELSAGHSRERTSKPLDTANREESYAKKVRKPKKGRNSDKDAESSTSQEKKEVEPTVKVELSDAPLPVFNPWTKRMEAQSTKGKAVTTVAPPKLGAAAEAFAPASAQEKKVGDTKAPLGDGQGSGTTRSQASPISAANGKPQRRSTEDARPSGEQPRRNGSRGNRLADKDETRTSTDSLPPVQDASLWPTPNAAATVEDGKPKVAEKSDRVEKDGQEEAGHSKPRQKEKWVAIPFVPTTKFETPLPNIKGNKPRGGARGGRESGARGGHGNVSGPASSEKMASTSGPTTGKDRPRASTPPTRAPSQAAGPTKRASMDGSYGRDQRKPSVPTGVDRMKEVPFESSYAASKGDYVGKGHRDVVNGDQQYHVTRNPADDHHFEVTSKNPDYSKDKPFPPLKDQGQSSGAFRNERGGSRGRGGRGSGHHGHPTQNHFPQTNYLQMNQRVATNPIYPSYPPYSPPLQQTHFGNGHNQGWGSKTNNRKRSITSGPAFPSRGPNGIGNAERLQPLQTGDIPYDYHLSSFSAQPEYYPPSDPTLVGGLVSQLQYYFSEENLKGDRFLRQMMDSQGFVPLLKIADFPRMKALAPSLNFIRTACEVSETLDYIFAEGVELIRARHPQWEQFVLPIEERNDFAQNSGPDLNQVLLRSQHSRPLPAPFFSPVFVPGYQAQSPTGFPNSFLPNGNEPMFSSFYGNGPRPNAPENGVDMNGQPYTGESQLSATVPDFSPVGLPGAPITLEDYQDWRDEEVEKLMLRMTATQPEIARLTPTGSDKGSADKVLNTNGIQGGEQDAPSHDGIDQGKSSTTEMQLPSSQGGGPKSPQKQDAVPAQSAGDHEHCKYTDLLARAHDQRKTAKPGETSSDMRDLYKFWPDVLNDHFNVRMYGEFRKCALEDARQEVPSLFGLKYLLQYYKKVLEQNNGKPYPTVFIQHQQEAQQLSESVGVLSNGDTRA